MSSSWPWEAQMADFRCERAHTHPAAGRAAIQNSPLGDLSWCHLWTVAPHASLALGNSDSVLTSGKIQRGMGLQIATERNSVR